MKLKRAVVTSFFIGVALMLAACIQPLPSTGGETAGQDATGGEEQTLYVGPTMADCVGVAPQTCLLVKATPDADYQYFYSRIDGFDYVPGYEYELRVQVSPVADAPADGSSLHYTLIEIVNQTEVGPTLEKTPWQLTTYRDANGEISNDLPGNPVTADFAAGQLNGNAGCNNYFGFYILAGSRLTIDNLGSTMMACLDPVMAQEQAYLTGLAAVGSYTIVGEELRLADGDGRTILTYAMRELPTLTGTTWSALGVNNGRGGVQSLVIDTEITAVFGDDGTLSGNAGCNTYSASYTVDNGTISVGPAAVTMMMCAEPDGLMEQESNYLAALERATVYYIDGERLQLRDDGGALQVDYLPVTGDDAAATAAPAPTDDELTQTLANLEYTDIAAVDGPVQMTDGQYEGEPFVEGGAARPMAMVTDQVATGDMDGVPSAAAVIFSTAGGSGNFFDLALVQDVDGTPTNVGTVFLGDRVTIEALAIQESQVLVAMITQGPNDPMCCATQKVFNTYGMVDGEFVQTSSTITGYVAPDNGVAAKAQDGSAAAVLPLIGTTWEWIEFQGGDDSTITVPNPTAYTVLLNPDASAIVKADCNTGTGSYNLNGSSLTFGMMAMTMAMCPEDSLSDDFLRLLGDVVTYVQDGDTLVLNLRMDAGKMIFKPLGTTPDANEEVGTEAIQQALANLEYTDISAAEGPVQLTNGAYEGEPFVPGGASRPTAQLTEFMAVGPINGAPSAAVIITSNAGGSGTFYDLALVQEQDGAPVNVATTQLGDRIVVNAFDIEENNILIDMVTQGPGDAMCCPTQRVFAAYELEGGELVQTTSAVLGYVDAQSAPPVAADAAGDAASAVDAAPAAPVELSPATVPSDAIELELNELASSYHWRVVPATPFDAGAMSGMPAHIVVTFDYENPDAAARAITVVPVAAYQALGQANGEDAVTRAIGDLTTLLADRPAAPATALPLLPPGMGQAATQIAYVDWNGGAGVRAVAPAGQGDDVNYMVQGLTDDGEYLVTMQWPVTSAGAADRWTPTLEALDALIGALTIALPAGN